MTRPQYKRCRTIFMILAFACLVIALMTPSDDIRIGYTYYLIANCFLCKLAHEKYHEHGTGNAGSRGQR